VATRTIRNTDLTPDGLRRGDTVRVRSLDEILATLDGEAKLDGVPFMPEMIPFCGGTFQVYRRAEKTCVEGLGMRSLRDTVLLEGLRCNGSAHDGCQRGCLFFWKKAWLEAEGGGRKAEGGGSTDAGSAVELPNQLPTTKDDRFYCQSTELAAATSEYPPGKLGHYWHDLRVGEMTVGRLAFLLWMTLANRIWRLLRGRRLYQITGRQRKTVAAELNLQPGEWVQVKSAAEIEATLDAQGRNRGLQFEPEMARHCGRRYRVASPVRTIIAEESGKMVQLSHTVILEGVACEGLCFHNCPRANLLYWREIWLRRV
jgi:hypothetical protein